MLGRASKSPGILAIAHVSNVSNIISDGLWPMAPARVAGVVGILAANWLNTKH